MTTNFATGYLSDISESIEKSTRGSTSFFRFKLQISDTDFRSIICFKLTMMDHLKKLESEGKAVVLSGIRPGKGANDFSIGDNGKYVVTTVRYKRSLPPPANSVPSDSFEVLVQAISCLFKKSENDKEYFRFLVDKDGTIASVICFTPDWYSAFVDYYLTKTVVKFSAKRGDKKGGLEQFIVQSSPGYSCIEKQQPVLDTVGVPFYGRRLFGCQLNSNVTFAGIVSAAGICIEIFPVMDSDTKLGFQRVRFYEPYDDQDFIVRSSLDNNLPFKKDESFMISGLKHQVNDDCSLIVSFLDIFSSFRPL